TLRHCVGWFAMRLDEVRAVATDNCGKQFAEHENHNDRDSKNTIPHSSFLRRDRGRLLGGRAAGTRHRQGRGPSRQRSSRCSASYEAFRQGLRALGYTEGKNVVLEIRCADGKSERLPDLARELVSLRPDVITIPLSLLRRADDVIQ